MRQKPIGSTGRPVDTWAKTISRFWRCKPGDCYVTQSPCGIHWVFIRSTERSPISFEDSVDSTSLFQPMSPWVLPKNPCKKKSPASHLLQTRALDAPLQNKQDGTPEPECKHVLKIQHPNKLRHSCRGHYCRMHSFRTHSCGALLQDTLVGHSCRTLLWDTLVGHSCRTLL